SATNKVFTVNGAGTAEPTGTNFALTADSTAPTTTITCNGAACAAWYTSSVTVALSANDGAGSGLAQIKYTTDGTDPTTSGTAQTYAAPFLVAATATIKFASVDAVGNQEAVGSQAVQIDGSAPTHSLALAASPTGAYLTGSTLYFRGVAAGSFGFTDTLADSGGSGAASVQYPAIGTAGWTHATETVATGPAYASSTYSWSASPSGPAAQTLVAKDVAGNATNLSVTFTDDSTAPTVTAPSVTGGWYTSASVPVTTTAPTDNGGGSGVNPATVALQRDETTLSNGSC